MPPTALLIELSRCAVRDREEHEPARHAVRLVWIGRSIWPYPPALDRSAAHGHADLSAVSLWIDPATVADRLWTLETVLQYPGLALVIADGAGFSRAATRRLQLRAQQAGRTVLLVRPPSEAGEISHAASRWLIAPCRDIARPETNASQSNREAPGEPVAGWRLTILRARAGAIAAPKEPSTSMPAATMHRPITEMSWEVACDASHDPVD
ncbi:MAG: hypothetical protein JJU36_07760 [Phycisphaeraceae bacterium]|nr:hypothetical protein [Phycisphaeraceae bacterium]